MNYKLKSQYILFKRKYKFNNNQLIEENHNLVETISRNQDRYSLNCEG
jgi:hypothetical protein